jgi:fido (protein-threonine AMPylation protein)
MSFDPIDGETPIDPSFLKIPAIITRAQLSPFEAENIRRAHVKYLSRKPSQRMAKFDLAWFLQLHKEMYCDVWKWAGVIRDVNLPFGSDKGSIVEDLESLVRDLDCWTSYRMGMLEQAARLHHRAVRIHPFHNGNGRWSRLLSNIWLRMHDQPLTDWQEGKIYEHRSVIREEYLAAVRTADGGNLGPLIELHRRYSAVTE